MPGLATILASKVVATMLKPRLASYGRHRHPPKSPEIVASQKDATMGSTHRKINNRFERAGTNQEIYWPSGIVHIDRRNREKNYTIPMRSSGPGPSR